MCIDTYTLCCIYNIKYFSFSLLHVYTNPFFDVHVYIHFCFVVVVETSCSGACWYESAVLLNNFVEPWQVG